MKKFQLVLISEEIRTPAAAFSEFYIATKKKRGDSNDKVTAKKSILEETRTQRMAIKLLLDGGATEK